MQKIKGGADNMAKQTKEFNTKLYAIVVFFVVAALLATITVTTYKSKYNGFSAEKTAVAFTQTIVERGDGYNAYKNTIISKNYKYGDYIREYYMYPVIYVESNYKPGDNRDNLKGYTDESFMGEKTKTDDGTLAGQVIDTMYPYYVKLIENNNGWDNYDVIFTEYFKKLTKVRFEVFNDKYMSDEIMFTALEANVAEYGEQITGIADDNTPKVNSYTENYGKGFKFTYKVTDTKKIKDLVKYKNNLSDSLLLQYGVSLDDISEAARCTVEVMANGKSVAHQKVTLVKIKNSWYVDNMSTSTAELYELNK